MLVNYLKIYMVLLAVSIIILILWTLSFNLLLLCMIYFTLDREQSLSFFSVRRENTSMNDANHGPAVDWAASDEAVSCEKSGHREKEKKRLWRNFWSAKIFLPCPDSLSSLQFFCDLYNFNCSNHAQDFRNKTDCSQSNVIFFSNLPF